MRGYQLRHLSIYCQKNYLFAAGFAGGRTAVAFPPAGAEFVFELAFAAGAFAAGTFADGAELAFEFVSATGAVFAFASAGAVFAFASTELAGASAGVSGLLERTETLPVNAGIARNNAESIKVDAAMIVIFDRTVAVPRGARAELETLLVNNAPASVLPGCRRTDATRTIQDKKNIAYKM